jgi:hypothetical protein
MPDENTAAQTPAAPDSACSAAEALRRAKAELEKVQAFYEDLGRQTSQRWQEVRKKNLGDLVDGTLNTVRRHPAAGLTLAALAGFFLGRLFRK